MVGAASLLDEIAVGVPGVSDERSDGCCTRNVTGGACERVVVVVAGRQPLRQLLQRHIGQGLYYVHHVVVVAAAAAAVVVVAVVDGGVDVDADHHEHDSHYFVGEPRLQNARACLYLSVA